MGNDIQAYEEVYRLARALSIPFDKKYLIKTNLKRKPPAYSREALEADRKILRAAFPVLLQLRVKNPEETQAAHQHLKAFREAFTRRYEERQMPLLEVLDNVSGIGYL